ncbi:NAD(P)-binding protein [Aaosphaeria arxii CBS 175.79]|uniref:NAD(P)-binding protein n=1 Tax=Aaosphaeria arxii CBS 175.79 TaxID=1450172 RepID=A0A6A5XVZ4_9PLEO|nr:NAD(P)-binding protein [Aaosphaeria arxii CBS 175.79]KAF2017495.1 NAD(P)-binding protein [Aaosphaeria arxii CBS 175.79]
MSAKYILITGAGGFIGQELAAALLESDSNHQLVLADVFEPPSPQNSSSRVRSEKADLTSSSAVDSLLSSQQWHATYLLHGIMSGGAEANLDLGLAVNLDSHRFVLDYLRKNQPGVIVVFPSSLAIYGPPEKLGDVVSEKTIPIPQSSYGAEKLIIETLVNDFSRRGLIDGRVTRLPTVIVRPGAPSAAASSFASGIVREPLKGEKSALPVSRDLEMWVASPKTVVKNLVAIKDVPKEKFGKNQGRVVNLPGQTVKVSQILDALKAVGGQKALDLVEEKHDPKVEAIVASWPARFDITVARGLGMAEDIPLTEEVQNFARSLKA